MHSQISRMIITVFSLSLALSSRITAEEKAQVAKPLVAQQALKAIKATRDSSFFSMRGGGRHPVSLHYPAVYKVVPNSHKNIFKTKNFYLIGDRATMVTERYSSIVAINPKTKKSVKFESIDVWRDIWLKINGKWFLKNAKPLSGHYMVDGRTPMFD